MSRRIAISREKFLYRTNLGPGNHPYGALGPGKLGCSTKFSPCPPDYFEGSTTSRIWSQGTSGSLSTIPDGQRISTSRATVS